MKRFLTIRITLAGALAATLSCSVPRHAGESTQLGVAAAYPRENPFVERVFRPFSGDHWIGNAVAYGPFRDGQSPAGTSPSKAELRQDIELMSEHWQLFRMYGAVGSAQTVLETIREDDVDMKMMVGVWLGVEEGRNDSGVVEQFPEVQEANRGEVETAIRLAAEYPNIVVGIAVGNETQVFWSAHRIPQDLLIDYVREVRARTRVPVTVADDFNFWNKPESAAVAREVDFIVLHAHPLWNGLALDDALDWTQRTFTAIRAAHPARTIVLGETGWATQRHSEGEQAELMKGTCGEPEQAIFYHALRAWADEARIPAFFF